MPTIQLDDIGEKSMKEVLERVEAGRLDPPLRKRNDEPESMGIYKRGDDKNADQS